MIKNNKGETLVELLIVIVVMGIIAAFAIPSVGNIIENTNKDAILNDAIQVENAAKLICVQTVCAADEALTYGEIAPYIDGLTGTYYTEVAVGTDDLEIARLSGGSWTVRLVATVSGEWEFIGWDTPSDVDNVDRNDVTAAPNPLVVPNNS